MSNSADLSPGATATLTTITFASYDVAPDSGTAVGAFGATSLSTEDYGSSHFSSLHDSLENRPSAFSDAFQTRWRQAWVAMQAYRWCEEPDEESLAQVRTQLRLLIKLLSEESNQDADLYSVALSSPKLSPLAQYLIYEEMLTKLNNWLKSVCVADIPLFFQVLQIYQFVLEQLTPANCRLVLQQSRFSTSLTELLEFVPEYLSIVYSSGTQKIYKTMFEECLVQLLHTVCSVLDHDPHLHRSLLLMEDDSSFSGSSGLTDIKFCGDKLARGTRWPLFELLVGFLHRPNLVGERARESMLICLNCTKRYEYLGSWVVDETDFCPLLATGLSGLFSELPRALFSERMSPEHFRVYHEMLESTSELQLFLRCLRFCDEALARSHPFIQVQFYDFFFNGFLLPVLGPALHQSVTNVPIRDLECLPQYSNTVDEIITTTAYFDLFLRTISEPLLVKLFIEFVLHDHYDNGVSMLDIFLTRFPGKSKTNCEDLRRALVTQFLGPDDGINDCEQSSASEQQSATINSNINGNNVEQTAICNSYNRSPVMAMFNAGAQTPGVNSSLMMNYTRHWISFSSLKLLKCLNNYLPSTRNSHHEQFTFYLNYLSRARESYQHFQKISDSTTVPWIAELLKDKQQDKKWRISPQVLSQLFASHPHDKTQFLAFFPFCVKNCHYDEERKQIHITVVDSQQVQTNGRQNARANKNAKNSLDSSPVGVFLDTLHNLIRNFFKNDVCTNLHVTELLSTLLQTPDRRLFGLLFDETLTRPFNIRCLLHTLQILSVEGQHYTESIPNFETIFASVKCALFPDDHLGNRNANNNNNSYSNQSTNGDGKGRKRFTLRGIFNRLSINNNNAANGTHGLGMINGLAASLIGGGQQTVGGNNRRASNASMNSIASSQVQVNQSATSVRYFNQTQGSAGGANAERQHSHIIHNLIIFDHFLLELSAILLEISVVLSPDEQ